MSRTAIQTTKNYRLFERHSNENRPLDNKKHRRLLESMKRYGFLECCPIICHRNSKGLLVVDDGQHRLEFAEALGLPVHWIERNTKFDIAVVNSTSVIWKMDDYARRYAAAGNADYQEVVEYAERYKIPFGLAFSLMAGTTWQTYNNDAVVKGEFKVKDREHALTVADLYTSLAAISPKCANSRMLQACAACCRVSDFKIDRLLTNARRCQDKLVSYSTRDAYLGLLEEIYNYGHSRLFGLKAAAMTAMRERNPVHKKSAK